MTDLHKTVLLRFVRGGIASMFATMSLIVTSMVVRQGGASLYDVQQLIYALFASGIVGFLSGFIQAGEKYYRSSSIDSPQGL